MSKAADEYYKNITPIVVSATLANNYIKELEEENEHLKIMNDRLNFQKVELIEKFKDLLDESMIYYSLYPNCHRMTVEEYFETEIELLKNMR